MLPSAEHRLAAEWPADKIRQFYSVFANANYTEEGLVGTLGPVSLPTRLRRERAHFRHLTSRGRPLDTLLRLFLLGIPATIKEASAALAPVPLDEWVASGLLSIDGPQARGMVRLMAFRGWLLACEQHDLWGTTDRPDAVMAISASTSMLADFAVPLPSRATLDIGTGNGVQAFLLAKQSERVYGVDCSARAVNFARFTAALNAAPCHIEFVEGDGFEPVPGLKFDLIVSNPPFAITPRVRYVYRDSGMPADGFARAILKTGAERLNEGGVCQVICDWVHCAGQDWKERLSSWFADSGCDAWVIRTDTHDAAEYARMWIRDTEQMDEDVSDRLYDDWLAHYKDAGIDAISTGLIAIRKTADKANWVRIDESAPTYSGPFGKAVLLGFEMGDFARSVARDEALLATRLKVAPSVRLDHVCTLEDGSWRIQSAKIRLMEGLQFEGNMDLRLAGMIALCDGRRTMREVIARTAEVVCADFDRVAPNCLAITRQLLERAFLIP